MRYRQNLFYSSIISVQDIECCQSFDDDGKTVTETASTTESFKNQTTEKATEATTASATLSTTSDSVTESTTSGPSVNIIYLIYYYDIHIDYFRCVHLVCTSLDSATL